jgi:hypothetical protein
MQAPVDQIKIHSSYICAMSFTPTRLLPKSRNTFLNLPSLMSRTSVKKIADSQQVLMMLQARKDWGWKHEFDLEIDDSGYVEKFECRKA